ncbi:MAG: hypothetical protein ACRETC_07850 [Gammaproteobacteria bacterium]
MMGFPASHGDGYNRRTTCYLHAMQGKLARNVFSILCAALLCAGCSSMGTPRHEPDQSQAPSREIAILNHGYAMLYNRAQEFSKIDKLLYVKINTDAVGNFIDALGKYGDTMQKQLESLTRRYPSLSLKDTGLPVIEAKKRSGVAHYYLMSMLPLVGKSGKAFDRTILQVQSEELNQARFYVRALISEERNDNRKQLLEGMKKRLDQFYKQVSTLLEKNYYQS